MTRPDGSDPGLVDGFAKALNRTERQLLMLFYAEELTTSEIALVLGSSEPHVRQQLAGLRDRARQALSGAAVAVGAG